MKSTAWLLAALVAGSAASAMAQAIVPNPSFEEGTDRPAGWSLSGDEGQWLSHDAANGQRAIAVTGSGQDQNSWHSDPLPLAPSSVYRLAFRAKATGQQGGTPVSGPVFCNRDLGSIPEQWTAYQSVFVTPESVRPENARLRFGQWHVQGTIAFDAVELQAAHPLYKRAGDLTLGEGESIMGQEYSFEAPLAQPSRNHSRPLVGYTCGFNTDRWVLGTDEWIIYRHQIAGRNQAGAEVRVSVTWHAAGLLVVEASADGKTWHELGTIDKVAGRSLKVPPHLLPAEQIWVRLRALARQVSDPVSLQVGEYGYKAVLTGPPATLIGETRFAAALSTDPRLNVTIQDLGEAMPGGRNVIRVLVKNSHPQTISTEQGVAVQAEGRPATTSRAAAVIEPGESSLSLPYELPGPGLNTLHYTLGQFKGQVSVPVAELHDASYGERLPASNEQVGLWWASSGYKVSRTRPLPLAAGKAMLIRAARNEAEAAQLVIRPASPLHRFTSQPGPLIGPDGTTIPAENVQILRVHYLMITRPTDHTGTVAPWPDPLPPFAAPVELEAGRNQPLWVRVKVPRDAKPGIYSGKIRLAADNCNAEVPLQVEVYDFTLPDRMTCATAFGFSPNNVWRYHKLQSTADRRAVLDKYLASFSEHHISPYDPAPLDNVRVSWPDRQTFVPTIDFTAWDAAMTRAIDHYHFNTFMLHVPGMGGGTFHDRVEPELLGYRENTPQYQAAFRNYCRIVEDHLRQKGWLDEAYVYWFDEPDPKDYQFVMNGFRKLKQSAPGINRMLTEQVEPALIGGPNIWCPITPEYKHAPAEERRKAGEKFWWYVCTGPKAPYCTLFIDHPASELRAWLWQTWQRKIDGILVWETTYWTSGTAYPNANHPQNPYEDPMSWMTGYGTPIGTRSAWGNGDGRFIYPPEAAAHASPTTPVLDGPVDSIRWEMLRDGIEDYEYLAILRNLLASKGSRLTPTQRTAFHALLEVPPDITRDITTFTKAPEPIERHRHAVAKAVEILERM